MNFKFISLIFLTIAFFKLSSCNEKYEEDPFSMRFIDFDKRINGEWKIDKILIDGVDSTKEVLMDTLKIFSTYDFHKIDRLTGRSRVTLKTLDGSLVINEAYYVPVSDKEKIKWLYFSSSLHESFFINNKIGAKGPLNKLNPNNGIEWEILKLTKEEIHLSVLYNKQKFELFFDKI